MRWHSQKWVTIDSIKNFLAWHRKMLIFLAKSNRKNQLIETHHLRPILSPISFNWAPCSKAEIHHPEKSWLRHYTLNKKGTSPNPQKRFCRFENDCKCVERFKERIKKSTKPLKDLPVCPGEDPFFLGTFLSSVEKTKGFARQFKTFGVSY